MPSTGSRTCLVLWASLASPVVARTGPPEALPLPAERPEAQRPVGEPTRAVTRRPAELTLVVWYDRRKPLETFRHQVYDLRRNEYTAAVDAWLRMVPERFPGYEAYARDVDLSKVKGDNEKHKIGASIVNEFLVVGARHGYDFSPDTGALLRATRSPLGASPAPLRLPAFTGPRTPNPGLPGSSSPFPLPYPRPHP